MLVRGNVDRVLERLPDRGRKISAFGRPDAIDRRSGRKRRFHGLAVVAVRDDDRPDTGMGLMRPPQTYHAFLVLAGAVDARNEHIRPVVTDERDSVGDARRRSHHLYARVPEQILHGLEPQGVPVENNRNLRPHAPVPP